MLTSILVVDDDALLCRALTDRLEDWGHSCESVRSGEEAIHLFGERHFDLVLLDLKLPRTSGLQTLKQLRATEIPPEIVVLTAHGSFDSTVEAIKNGATDYLPMPADFELLRKVVDRTFASQRLVRVADALHKQHVSDCRLVPTHSPSIDQLLDTACRVAPTNATVLLHGPSGSGKQVFAEYIHTRSERRAAPFVCVNCVAINDELLESTLFGHVKGAFTGAIKSNPGLLETASGGTAFLDEIGDVSPKVQAKLLHFLETRQFQRVGSPQTISVDCRIIAATNRDLARVVTEGGFREDLFYRLNVIELNVPPLRDRREDILDLANGFIERFSRELKRPCPKLGARTAEIMVSYGWPGNVRQLKNAMERMVVLARTETLTPDLLPPEVWRTDSRVDLDSETLPLRDAVAEFRKQYVSRVLEAADGNQTKAAQQLGVQTTFLNRLIKRNDIGKGHTADAPHS